MYCSIRFLVAGAALSAFAGSALAGDVGVGTPAPPLKAHKWIKGEPVKLGDGKVHVIEMWATW